MSERRAHPRYELRLAAEITTQTTQFTAVTRDVSEGGLCLESAYGLEEGATVQVALFLVVDGVEQAGMPPLSLPASVQWSAHNEEAPMASRHLAGLKFQGMSPEQRTWLLDVLKRTAS